MIDASLIQTLLDYPQAEFGEVASPRWKFFCENLATYKGTESTLSITADRKWELLSALQKSIRRGRDILSLQLISKALDLPTVRAQLSRRLAVIACEDVGLGDETLTRLVVACSAVFTPKRHRAELSTVLSFVTSQMCSVPARSRIACSLSLIAESIAAGFLVPDIKPEDQLILSALQERTRQLQSPDTPWRRWQRRNDWRGERMLRYLDLPLPFEAVTKESPIPKANTLEGLPAYCYDMHTRLGRSVIQRLMRGTPGAERLKRFFATHRVPDRSSAVGMALFYSEGGLLQNELAFVEVLDLEQRTIAQRFGLKIAEWNTLRCLTDDALRSGVIDRLRGEELERRASQMLLPFRCDERGTEEGNS